MLPISVVLQVILKCVSIIIFFACFSVSRVMSPISVTTMQPSVSTVSAQALHQLPTVITKPKVMVTNAAQMVLNGPSHTLSNSSLTNGAHAEIKKENNLPAFSLGRLILSSCRYMNRLSYL